MRLLSALIFSSPFLILLSCKRTDPAPAPAKNPANPATFGLDPLPIAPTGPVNTRVDTSVPTQLSPLPTDQRPPAAPVPARADIDITSAVRQAISGDPTLSRTAQLIDVTTTNGVVRLSGTLLTEADKENLRIAVARVPGVRSIDNWIIFKK